MGGKRGRRADEAFERFCADEYPYIVNAVALVVGNVDVATDAVNEALARAWNRVRKGETIETLGAWIRVVAFNVGYDHLRRRTLEAKTLHKIAPDETRAQANYGPSVDMRTALAELPPRQREVTVLHYFCDLPITEIAEALDISTSTVKSSLQQARSSLYGLLAEDAAEEVYLHDAS